MIGVAVVIPCFDLGRTVGEAVESVRAQTRPASELVVVDDGSTDLYTRHVLARLQTRGVAVIRTEHQGVAWARAAGVAATRSRYIVLLDADDMLAPTALQRLAEVLDTDPEVDFVTCGIEAFGETSYIWHPPPCTWTGVLTRGGPHVSSMMRRTVWQEVGGFRPDLPGYEDTDFWLDALEKGFRGEALPDLLLRYRVRPGSRYEQALETEAHRETMASIYARHWPPTAELGDIDLLDVLLEKETFLEEQRGHQRTLIHRRHALQNQLDATRADVAATRAELATLGHQTIDWGDLGRTEPVSVTWGLDRGQPVDRVYIERFLEQHREDIQGQVLEVKDAGYTRHFGGDRVTRIDVLDINEDNPEATLVADLASPAQMPAETYDCIVLTQTTHIIYDTARVIESVYKALRPGGVLLCTVPCLSRVSTEDTQHDTGDFWRFTEAGVRHLFSAVFPLEHLEITSGGNLMTSAAFLLGLAAHEVPGDELDRDDPWHPLVCLIRATKPWSPPRATGSPVMARRSAPNDAAVLLYHRVNSSSSTYPGGIDEADFRAQMQQIKDQHNPMPLDALVEGANTSVLPERAVALTFDDGYLQHLTLVAPILEELGLPATFYVSTADLDTEHEFYWDTLDRVLLDFDQAVPGELDLFGERSWTKRTATKNDRLAAHRALLELLYDASETTRSQVVARLGAWCGRDLAPRPTHRRLTGDEVRRLNEISGMTVGVHTHHHLHLPAQDDRTRWQEVNDSRAVLETLLGGSVDSFSYPYGEHDGRTTTAVSAAGFTHAVAVDDVAVTSAVHPLLVPRLEVRAGDRLAARLDKCLGTSRFSR